MTKFEPTVAQLIASLKRSSAARDQVGTQRAIDELIERAWKAIDTNEEEEQSPEPLEIARALQEIEHPAGFELETFLLDQEGKTDEAVTLLRKAVGICPNDAHVWELLGNVLSDAEQFDEAQKSFEKALSLPDAFTPAIRFNYALSLCRQERHQDALPLLEAIPLDGSIDDLELVLHVTSLKTSVLNTLDRFQEAVELADRIIKETSIEDCEEDCVPHLAEIHAQRARAGLGLDEDADVVMRHALEAVAIDQANEHGLDIFRVVRDRVSATAKGFQITVRGTWPEKIDDEDDEPPCFYQNYVVIADTQEEAYELAKELCPEPIRGSISMEEGEAVKDMPNEAKGVIQISPYVFFRKQDEENLPS